ncbi:MAG: hypothetical protein JWN61_2608 [Pseudonocardiales bacterium]|nr:hypothetical protein [Pseudonocardiales bacterium]
MPGMDAKPSRETLKNQVVDTFQMLTFMLGEALGQQLPKGVWELTQQRTERIVDAIETGDEAGIASMLMSLSALVDACHVAVEDWGSDDQAYLRMLAEASSKQRRAG